MTHNYMPEKEKKFMLIKPYQPDTSKNLFTSSEKETMEWLSLIATIKIKEIQQLPDSDKNKLETIKKDLPNILEKVLEN